MTKGVQDYKTGHYADAAKNLSAAVKSDFNDPILHYYLGSSYVRLQQKDAAIREFRIAFALQPDEEVGRLSKQALALLGVEMGSDVEVTSMFIIAPAPKPKLPPGAPDAATKEFADLIAKLQKSYIISVLSPPNNGAEHFNQLQPLGPEWRAQERFDDSRLPICNCDGPWFRLPAWLTGTWRSAAETATQTYSQDFVTKGVSAQNGEVTVSRSTKSERWGVVLDKQGNYWEHPCVPSVARDTAKGTLQIEVGVKFIPIESSTQRVSTYYRWINFQLSSDHKIQAAKQCELISTYTPIGTGYCQKLESLKEFDQKGAPIKLTKYRFYMTETQPPKLPVSDPSGRDYLSMFRKYLKDNNQLSFMP
jgi:hypothetical protein